MMRTVLADGSVDVQFGGCDGKNSELPSDHAWLELYCPPLLPASGDRTRQVEVFGGDAS